MAGHHGEVTIGKKIPLYTYNNYKLVGRIRNNQYPWFHGPHIARRIWIGGRGSKVETRDSLITPSTLTLINQQFYIEYIRTWIVIMRGRYYRTYRTFVDRKLIKIYAYLLIEYVYVYLQQYLSMNIFLMVRKGRRSHWDSLHVILTVGSIL